MTTRRPPLAGGRPPAPEPAGAVYFEFIVRGNATRCAAIDAATGAEVVVVGPANASEAHLKIVALRKLRMRLARA